MYESIVRGVETAAEKHGYNVMVASQIEGRSADAIARLLQEGRVDGLLVASGLLDDAFIRQIATGPGPVITVNRRVQGVLSSVVVDDERASATAVEFLGRLGHRRLGGIFGPARIDTSIRRRKGFVMAAKQARLEVTCADCESWSAGDGYRGTLEILKRSPGVTAIYASTFLMGVGALRAAVEEGRTVPGDISVLSLHDNHMADYLSPPLTTIRLPTEQMGAAAVEMLIERRDGKPPEALVIEGEGELIVRKSTSPARLRRNNA
jgi:LacI family transcriptional regulator